MFVGRRGFLLSQRSFLCSLFLFVGSLLGSENWDSGALENKLRVRLKLECLMLFGGYSVYLSVNVL